MKHSLGKGFRCVRVGLAALAAAAILTGCRTFESEWQERRTGSVGPASTTSSADLRGTWVGTWQNTNNTHGGALRAIIDGPAPVAGAGEQAWKARFHATWGRHSGSFRTVLKGRVTGDAVEFHGTKHIAFVRIDTDGRATATNFFSTYTSRFDSGTFTLERPAEAAEVQGSKPKAQGR